MHRILNTIGEGFTEEAKNILDAVGDTDYLELTQDKLLETISEYDVVVIGLGLIFNKEVLDRAKKLKVIATATTGLNHIDLEHAKKGGVTILSLKGENEFLDTITSTGELAFSLMLDLMRFNPWAFESVKKYEWDREQFRGSSLYGKTIGIVGMGRLGKIVAAAADGFRMNVIFCDPNVLQEAFPEYTKVSFEELLKRSDVVSLHVHLVPETEKLIGASELKKMKNSAFLINTSRGEIVDEDALLKALNSKEIAGYATDVLDGELSFSKNFSNNPLVEHAKKHRNVIIVPHIGGMTEDSRIATDVFISQKLRDFLRSQTV